MDPGAYEEPENEDIFTNRPPTPAQAQVLDAITDAMKRTDAVIMSLPPSRFRSAARSKLEECSMWAKKATVFTVHGEPASAAPGTMDPAQVGYPPPPLTANPRDLP